MIFGLSKIRKMPWKSLGKPQFAVNDVKSIHFRGYATAGCIETVHLSSLESEIAVANFHSFTMVKLNPSTDFINDYGLKASTLEKIKAMDELSVWLAYEKAWDRESIHRYGHITDTFRSRKYPVCDELKQYIKKIA